MFGRVGFGVHDLFGGKGPEVAHLLRAMEESGAKNSSLLTRRFLPDAFDFHTALVWTVMNDGGSRTSSPPGEGEDRSGMDAISTVQTSPANVGSLPIEPIPTGIANGRFGASRPVPSGKAERPLSVSKAALCFRRLDHVSFWVRLLAHRERCAHRCPRGNRPHCTGRPRIRHSVTIGQMQGLNLSGVSLNASSNHLSTSCARSAIYRSPNSVVW
jgi:hypothetical protein